MKMMFKLNEEHLISSCPAGLGNRLKCLVSTIKQCDGSTRNARVYWPINKECGCELNELLEPEVLEVWENEIGNTPCNQSWSFPELDFKYHKIPKHKREEMFPYFRYLIPKKDILDMTLTFLTEYQYDFNSSLLIGVHIRKGDFEGLYDGRKKISTENRFIVEMARKLKENFNYKFLLCTEDEGVEKRFKEIFGEDKILIFPKTSRERNDTTGVKEAFVDMLLLSQCPIIIGTFLSTFTELAWWFGKCEAEVIIPGADDTEAVGKVLARLPQQGELFHNKLWRKIKILFEGRGFYENR